MKAKKWIQKILILLFICFSLVLSINYIVDPYGLYKLHIFNIPKIKQADKMRLIKIISVQEIKPTSICLGTSRAESGYDPNHKYFIKPSYNFGISSSSMYEARLNFEWALAQGNLEKVLLVADYIMFNSKKQKEIQDFETYFKHINSISKYKYLFSIDTLLDSIITMRGNSSPAILYYNNGQRVHNYSQRIVDEKGGHKSLFIKNEYEYFKDYLTNYRYKDTKSSSFEDFEKIIQLCYENNIKLDIIFGPSHIRLWESLNYYLGYEKWLQWKKDVVISVNKISRNYNKQQFRVIDFSIYHFLTNETIPDDKNLKMKYYWESSHYKNKLGLIVLDKLIGKDDFHNFGIELNINNIDVHLKKLSIAREDFINIKLYQKEVWGESSNNNK